MLLVVEDSDTLRDVLEVALGLSGYHVICAGSAEEAVELARRTPELDLAIVDVTLPGQNGAWLVDALEREQLVRSWILMSGFPRQALELARQLAAVRRRDREALPARDADGARGGAAATTSVTDDL